MNQHRRTTHIAGFIYFCLALSSCASHVKPVGTTEKSGKSVNRASERAKVSLSKFPIRDLLVREEIHAELNELERASLGSSESAASINIAESTRIPLQSAGEARQVMRKTVDPSGERSASLNPGGPLRMNQLNQLARVTELAQLVRGEQSARLARVAGAIPVVTSVPTATAATTDVAAPSEDLAPDRERAGDTLQSEVTESDVGEPGQSLKVLATPPVVLKKLSALESSKLELSASNETPLIFDIPVTYNHRVSNWIRFFQGEGRRSFQRYLERSSTFLPILLFELTKAGLPQDLVYVAMIESGFKPDAVSHKGAMGLWQFMKPTARRYGMRIDWWIDERKDFLKATRAAIGYMTDLYQQFDSWYLVAASYNMGENGVARLIKKHGTNNFWELAELGALPRETTDYVPKIIAAMLISKAPALYGFRDLNYNMPLSFETVTVPGGTDLLNLAGYLGVSEKYLKDLNPELIKGFVPRDVRNHTIRIPKGSFLTVTQFVRLQSQSETL